MHVSFLDPLVVEYLDGRNWQVFQEFDFASEVLEKIVVVPKGFETDFASVPKELWNILSPTIGPGKNNYGKAACLHDYCYRTHGYCAKKDADHLFLEAMEAMGVNAVVRDAMYEAVHLFGGSSYKGGL